MTRKRDPMWEGKVFEKYAWPTVRRNYPRWKGWVRFEQARLPSGLRPDNVLLNEDTEDIAVIEMKDVAELTEAHLLKVEGYMVEIGADAGFVVIAWDTEVPRRVRRYARRKEITIRRTWWRRH